MSKRNPALAAAIGLSLVLLAGCDLEDIGSSERYASDFHYSYPLKEGGTVTLETFNGSVDISGSDSNTVEINGTKYANSPEARDAIKIDIQSTPGAVYIRTIRPSTFHGNLGAKFSLRVPRRVKLERVISSNGSIRVSDVEGSARMRTSNGGVRTMNLRGDLDAQTSNGGIDVQKHEGSAVLRTSNGRVHAEDVHGAIEAQTSNASINVNLLDADPSRPIRLASSNGGVDFTLRSPLRNDVRIHTSNAGITVHLPDPPNARISAQTSNGSIRTEFQVKSAGEISKHRLEGEVGSGGPLMDLSTSNGSIRLLRL